MALDPKLCPPDYSETSEKLYGSLDERYNAVRRELTRRKIGSEDMGVACTPTDPELPLVSIAQLSFPDDLTEELMRGIFDDLRNALAPEHEVDRVLRELESDLHNASHFVVSALADARPSEESAADSIRNLVAVLAVRPFLSWLSHCLETVNRRGNSWLQGACPCCGTRARLGRIDAQDGKLMLWCWLCETEWRFPRLMCPFCSQSSAEGQLYFTVRETPYRVELCPTCRQYLKVLDERRLADGQRVSLSWIMNDVLTCHLDALARAEGYRSPG